VAGVLGFILSLVCSYRTIYQSMYLRRQQASTGLHALWRPQPLAWASPG
jgi:hypothetical protein